MLEHEVTIFHKLVARVGQVASTGLNCCGFHRVAHFLARHQIPDGDLGLICALRVPRIAPRSSTCIVIDGPECD